MGDTEDFVQNVKTITGSLTFSDVPAPDSEFVRVIYHENKFIVIPKAVGRNYHTAFVILRNKASSARRQISDEQLEALFTDFLKKLLIGGEVNLTNLSSEVQALFNSVKRFTFSCYTVFVPIRHLSLAIDSIAIGHVEFVRISHALAQRMSSQTTIVRFLGNTSNNEDEILQGLQQFFKVGCLALVEVSANDDSKAVQVAIQRIEQSLNVLRYFRIDSAATIDGHGIDRASTKVLYWNSTLNSVGVSLDSSRLAFPRVTISQPVWDDRKKLGLADIHDLLLKPEDQLEQMEQDILSAVYWVGKSWADSSDTDGFIKIMSALDLLLAQDTRNKKEMIARRFTSIVYAKSSDQTILQIYDHVKKLYTIRNNIMHAGEKYVDKDTIAAARIYVILLLNLLLKNAKTYPTLKDLLDRKFPLRDDVLPPIE